MAFRIKKQEMKTVKEVFDKLRLVGASPNERPLKPARVKFLQEEWKRGRTQTFRWDTVWIKELNVEKRANGQHSTEAIYLLPEHERPYDAPVLYTEWEADTIDDFYSIYTMQDPARSSRGTTDYIQMYKGSHSELDGISVQTIKACMNGIINYERWVKGTKHSGGVEQYASVGRRFYWSFFTWWEAELAPALLKVLTNSAVSAAVYGTFLEDERNAKKFWEGLAEEISDDGEETPVKTPKSLLVTWLNSKEPGGRNHKAKDIYGRCIRAFHLSLKEVA